MKDPNTSSQDVHKALLNDGANMSRRTVRYAITEAGFLFSKPRYL